MKTTVCVLTWLVILASLTGCGSTVTSSPEPTVHLDTEQTTPTPDLGEAPTADEARRAILVASNYWQGRNNLHRPFPTNFDSLAPLSTAKQIAADKEYVGSFEFHKARELMGTTGECSAVSWPGDAWITDLEPMTHDMMTVALPTRMECDLDSDTSETRNARHDQWNDSQSIGGLDVVITSVNVVKDGDTYKVDSWGDKDISAVELN